MVKMTLKIMVWLLFMTVARTSSNEQATTPRTQPPYGATIKQLTNQLMELNTTSDITLDTRTPPRIKLLLKKSGQKPGRIENSHPGVAEPIDEDSLVLEESMKKLNFYKVEKPTTDSGLSTWILLTGQSTVSPSTTNTTMKTKQTVSGTKNATVLTNPTRIIKPLFKKRPIAMTSKSPVTSVTTVAPEKTTKLTRIKASVLKSVLTNKNASYSLNDTNTKSNTTHVKKKNEVKTDKGQNVSNSSLVTNSSNDNSQLHPELKDGDIDLSVTSTTQNPKKSRRPTNKKKKDKHRRRRPTAEDKIGSQNKTNIATKISQKEKPITTQIYNYLAREVMPTVGVGLVGLMVTAGLASYFLYPFGSLRRSYDIDRKDKEDTYYYDNDFASGIAEEDAIGKVIAGMPISSNYKSNRYQNSRHNYPYTRNRQVDQTRYTKPQASVETIRLNPMREYNTDYKLNRDPYLSADDRNEPITYSKDVISQNVEAAYTTSDQKFVVGNIPKEVIQDVTPAAVPEHGPRSLKLRKKRYTDAYISNEVQVDDAPTKSDEAVNTSKPHKENNSTDQKVSTTKPDTISTYEISDKIVSLFEMFRDLVNTKIRMGLEILQNKTIQFSRYISRVQERLNYSFKKNS